MVDRQCDARLRALAAKQHGAFSREQARQLGYTRTEIQNRRTRGEWVGISRGVYAIGGSPATWERRASAALLAAGDGAALSHLAAAACLGLIDGRPDQVDVVIPSTRRARGRHRVKDLARRDIVVASGLQVTNAVRTMVDLSGIVDRRALEAALDRGLVIGRFRLDRLRGYIDERGLRHLRGVGVLVALIDDREKGVPESELERRFERLLRSADLPRPVRQHKIGNLRIDFAYVDQRIAIELDGHRHHATKTAAQNDKRRQNQLVLAGWKVLRFTWDDITKRRDEVLGQLRAALRAGGGI